MSSMYPQKNPEQTNKNSPILRGILGLVKEEGFNIFGKKTKPNTCVKV